MYVKHAACFWLCNFARHLASLAEPKRAWRIVASPLHATVWNGENQLFDMQMLALGVPADEAWKLASTKGRMLPVGKNLPVHLAESWPVDAAKREREIASRK